MESGTTTGTGPPSGRDTLREWTAAIVRQSHLVGLCFVALSAGAVAAFVTSPKIYEADMTILVKRDRVDPVVSGTPDASGRSELSETEVLSQIELLRAEDLLERVAIEAGLAQPTRTTPPETTREELVAAAVGALQTHLTVAPIKHTWLIAVTYRSENRERARLVLDTLARLYLEKHLALRRPAGTYQFFTDQTARARQELVAAQTRLEQFGRSNQVVSAAAEKQQALQQLAEFEALQQQALATRAEAARRVKALDQELARSPAQRTSQVRTSDHAGLLQELQSRLLGLEFKRTELLHKYTPEYRPIVELDEQIAQVRAALAQVRDTPVKDETVSVNPTRQWADTELARARADRAAIDARARALSAAVDSYRRRARALEAQEIEQQDLARALKSAEAKYLLYEQKQEEARISDALDRTRIANVAIAQAPRVPLDPHRSRSLAWLLVLIPGSFGISLGLGLLADTVMLRLRPAPAAADEPPLHAAPSHS